MQRSLVELYSLDSTITYQHGFVFLRQLTVHLRTAIQTKKPVRNPPVKWHFDTIGFFLSLSQESVQSVYNWQFVHALGLWTNVVAVLFSNKEKLIQQLVHPLTELIIGTIR